MDRTKVYTFVGGNSSQSVQP